MPLWAWSLLERLKAIPPAPILPIRHTVLEAPRSSGRAHPRRLWVSPCVALPHTMGGLQVQRRASRLKWELLPERFLYPTVSLSTMNVRSLQIRRHPWDCQGAGGSQNPEPRRLCLASALLTRLKISNWPLLLNAQREPLGKDKHSPVWTCSGVLCSIVGLPRLRTECCKNNNKNNNNYAIVARAYGKSKMCQLRANSLKCILTVKITITL